MQKRIKTKHIIVVLLIIVIALLLHMCDGKTYALENTMENNSNVVEAPVNANPTVDAVEETVATDASEETEVTEPADQYDLVNQTVYAITGVNVRIDPNGTKVGELARGESVIRVAIGSNGWSKVIYNGEVFYVASKYLTTDKVEDETRTPVYGTPTTHTHNYYADVINPTCTENGYTVHRCNCGDQYVDSTVKAYGHDYVDTLIAPTTENGGYTMYACQECGYSYKDNFTDKLPVEDTNEPTAPAVPEATEPESTEHVHNYHATNVVKATCTSGGFTTYQCACGDSYNGDVTDPAGHSYGSEVVDPTTENGGYTLHVCGDCGDSYKDNFTDKIVAPEPEKPVNTHKHKEVTVGGVTYVYCSDVSAPYKGEDGTLYYPYDLYY